ncbi:hypothetical protein GIB67_027873, partial [Kingdonia uniflora]
LLSFKQILQEITSPTGISLQTPLQSNSDPIHHYNLEVFLWEKEEDLKELAVEHFVTSAKLNPNYANSFQYLGHYYSPIETQRALPESCHSKS